MSAMMECINRMKKNAIDKKVDDEWIVNCTCAGVNIVVAQRAHDGVYVRYYESEWEAFVLLFGDDQASLKRFEEGDGDEKVNAEQTCLRSGVDNWVSEAALEARGVASA